MVVVWKLKVCVRAKRFSLKLNLRNRLSSWKLHRLSFVLRFRNHHLNLKVDSQSKPDCFRFLRSRRREVDAKKLIELVWNRAVVVAKKARGVGAVTVVMIIFIIVVNHLPPWIKVEPAFQLGHALFFGIK